MKGEKVDYVPAGFWFHYKPEYTVEEMVDAHMKLYRETGMDIIKIMQDYMYPIVGEIRNKEDWYEVSVKDTSCLLYTSWYIRLCRNILLKGL